jgi:MoaA/NifB/PqqE/SkfB family radical SAM enzyme
MSLHSQISEAIEQNTLSGRLWLYSNYHCNLACRYCLTESAPSVPKRELSAEQLIDLAQQGHELGFTGIGITGGEPFLLPYLVDVLDEITQLLPVTLLTNGTLFNRRRLSELKRLVGRDLRMQISLDRPDPIENDRMRGPENFAKVVKAIPQLIDMGLHIRIATTIEEQSEAESLRLKELISALGIQEEDHIVRKVVSRGRAALEELGAPAPIEKLAPELTISVDGAFWSPFAPTYKNGKLQKDLLISTTIQPLSQPTRTLLDFMSSVPQEHDELEGFV